MRWRHVELRQIEELPATEDSLRIVGQLQGGSTYLEAEVEAEVTICR